MDKTVILAKKYGRAIYEIAVEQHTLEQTEKDLHLIATAIDENESLKKPNKKPEGENEKIKLKTFNFSF